MRSGGLRRQKSPLGFRTATGLGVRTENIAARVDLRLSESELEWFRAVAEARKETLSATIRSVMAEEAKRLNIPASLAPRGRAGHLLRS